MEPRIVNVSVVVLAKEHNPTILHPAFLESQEIAPGDWELAGPPVCTPPFSIVRYANGVVLTVEGNKFQVQHNDPPEAFWESEITVVASKYVRALPHVRYTAVGVNVTSYLACATPEREMLTRFLRQGVWSSQPAALGTIGLRLVYPLETARLVLSLDTGRVRLPGEDSDTPALLANANYHADLPAGDPVEAATQAIGLFGERCRHFLQAVRAIFEVEG